MTRKNQKIARSPHILGRLNACANSVYQALLRFSRAPGTRLSEPLLNRGVRHGAPRRTRFRNPLDFTWISDLRMDFWISKWISGFQIGFLDFTSLVPRPFPAPVLIACSIKTEGKAWEKDITRRTSRFFVGHRPPSRLPSRLPDVTHVTLSPRPSPPFLYCKRSKLEPGTAWERG